MLTELETGVSENPFFTQLVQEQAPEHEVRAVFGRLPAGSPLRPDAVTADIVHDPVLTVTTRLRPVDGEMYPYRASRFYRAVEQGVADAAAFQAGADRLQEQMSAPPAIPPSLVQEAFRTFVSTTPTGSINLRLRKQLDQ